MFVREGVNFGGKELSIETGRMAKQADGSVVVRYGDTMVLVTDDFARDVRLGRRVALEPGDDKGDQRLCLLDGGGKLVAVAQRREGGALEMLRVFGV